MTSKELNELKIAIIEYRKQLVELAQSDKLELNKINDNIAVSNKKHIEKLKQLEAYSKAKTALKKVVEYIKPYEVEEWLVVVLSDYNAVLIEETEIIRHAEQVEKEKLEFLIQAEYVAETMKKKR